MEGLADRIRVMDIAISIAVVNDLKKRVYRPLAISVACVLFNLAVVAVGVVWIVFGESNTGIDVILFGLAVLLNAFLAARGSEAIWTCVKALLNIRFMKRDLFERLSDGRSIPMSNEGG
jgi:uncharacterized membrane protein